MKRNITMKTVTKIGLSVCILAFATLACEQPFKAGLGPVVDIRPPTAELLSPNAGDYIWGSKLFHGTAEDDYKLDSVWIRTTNHPNNEYLREYTKVDMKRSGNKYLWEIVIDTTKFDDGDFKVQVKAVDSVNKTFETDEIAFFIKNSPPAISVAAPYIPRVDENRANDESDTEKGKVGGMHLNYGAVDELPVALTYPRKVDKGGFLTGTISDDEDIYIGPVDENNNRYPPQIRLWRVGGDGYDPGVLPSLDEVAWETFVLNENLYMLGVGNYQFVWEAPSEAGYFYGFEIRAQNRDGRAHFHYPCDFRPEQNWDDEASSFVKENRYVLFYVQTPREYPVVEIYGLDDIFGEWNRNTGYSPLTVEGTDEPLDDTRAHPYVNKFTVAKNGPFTLRIKASHSEGIGAVEVYWEKEGGANERGRFIWDPADKPPAGVTWADANNAPASLPYGRWGFRDPHIQEDGFYTTYNYIFTYKNDGANEIPDEGKYHATVRGKSQIQKYTPAVFDAEEWLAGKKSGLWSEGGTPPGSPLPIWEDAEDNLLAEGVYNIEVYARSMYGTAIDVPFTCSIRLDWVPPEVEINTVEGAAQLDLLNYTALVNGVIQPRMRFADSRAEDSGLRTGETEYYRRPNTTEIIYGYEQVFIVVGETDNTAMNTLISENENWWPQLPAVSGGALTIPGVTVHKHGPAFDSAFKIKTSRIYYPPNNSEEDTLPDGDYWLYVLSRDNAFNVGHSIPLKITVNEASDFPNFVFTGIGDEVKNPNLSSGVNPDTGIYDGWRKADGNTQGVITGSSTSIMLRLTDDDSLDLGTASAPSTMSITFVGSKLDTDGTTIVALDDSYLMTLDTREIFGVQTVDTSAVGGRQVVREKAGTITQRLLLDALRSSGKYTDLFDGDPASYTSLPDGIYRFNMSVADWQPAKLKMDADPAAPDIARKDTEFWIAVDTVPPLIEPPLKDEDGVSYAPELMPATVMPEYGKMLSADTEWHLIGRVSDRNGPVTIKSFTVTPTPGPNDKWDEVTPVQPDDDNPVRPFLMGESIDGLWQGDFNVRFTLGNGTAGTYEVKLDLEDRFGNVSSVFHRYYVDVEPPTVTLRKPMETFSRPEVDTANPGISSGDLIPNNTRLTNGVVSFTLSAVDNIRLAEVRWALFLATAAPTLPSSQDQAALGTFFNALDDGVSDAIFSGSIIQDFNAATFYIDTVGLTDDCEYVLYAMAEDGAHLYSPPASQRIYVWQEQDKPFFGDISPSDSVVRNNGLVIRGTIFEDDGFASATGAGIIGDAIMIYMYATDPGLTSGQDVTTIPTGNGRVGPVSITVPGRVAGKNLILDIDLRTTAFSAFNDILKDDGKKYYIIQATDSWYGKFECGTVASDYRSATPASAEREAADTNPGRHTRATRSKYFSFDLDTKLPEVYAELVDGVTEVSVLGSNTTATLKGMMRDEYLKFAENGDLYIKLKLDSGAEQLQPLGSPRAPISNWIIPGADPNGDIYEFELTFTQLESLLSLSTVAAGPHTLTLIVEDRSGQRGTYPLHFTLDMDAPTFTFTELTERKVNNATVLFPATPPADAAERKALYDARHAAFTEPLYVIQYGANAPYLAGTFNDTVSTIDNTSFRYYFDNDSTATLTDAHVRTWDPPTPVKDVRWSVWLTEDGAAGGTPLSDGIHCITFTIADAVGNSETYGPYAFRINSAPPSVVDITATPSGSVFGNAAITTGITVNGFAVSGSMRGARYVLRSVDNGVATNIRSGNTWSTPADTYITLDAVSEWTYDALLKERAGWSMLINIAALSDGGDGNYELALFAIDSSGNESDETVWPFTIDSTGPTFAFNNMNGIGNDGSLPPIIQAPNNEPEFKPESWLGNDNVNKIMGQNPRIQGSIEDTLSNVSSVERQISRYDYNDGSWKYYNFTTPGWVNGAPPNNANGWNEIVSTASQEIRLDWTLNGLTDFDPGYYRIQLRATDAPGNASTSPYVFFFYAPNVPDMEFSAPNAEERQFSSAVVTDNTLQFGVTATSPNMYDKLVVSIERVNTGTGGALPAIQTIEGPRSGSTTWDQTVTISFPPGTVNDGSYRLIFTVTDLAGRDKTITRTITMDNHPPTGRVEEPRLMGLSAYGYPDAGETIYGGEHYTIRGITSDPSRPGHGSGSASGVAGMWYHLGYLGAGTQASLTFPTEEQIKASVTYTGLDGSPASHTAFDTAAAANGNRWFKYDGGSYPKPNGLKLGDTIDLLNWEISTTGIDSLKEYVTTQINLKGVAYNQDSTGWMVKEIPEAGLPQNIAKPGLYSLPLWIRVADTVGNVSYFCRDIWLYPNGDYPTTTIINPSDKEVFYETLGGVEGGARGGMIGIDGVASDNMSVKNVIYRVKVDANNNASTWNTNAPPDINIVPQFYDDDMKDPVPLLSTSSDSEAFTLFNDQVVNITGNVVTNTGWHFATLESRDIAQSMPWSLILNRNNQLINAHDGFEVTTASGVIKMVRVWVEVFVFDGETLAGDDYHLISLGAENNPDVPHPYRIVFYVKSSSPKISSPMISPLGSINPTMTYGPAMERSGQFALSAALSGGGAGISQIMVLLPGEQGVPGSTSGWQTHWTNRGGITATPLPGIELAWTGAEGTDGTATLTYLFDSVKTRTAVDPGFASIRNGGWAESGGKYIITLRIRDDGSPPGEDQYTFEVGIDNYAPVADKVHNITNSKVAGSNVPFMGRAFDFQGGPGANNPPYRGINRIYAWFKQGDTYINMDTGEKSASPALAPAINAWGSREAAVVYLTDSEGNEDPTRDVSQLTVNNIGALQPVSYPSQDGWSILISEGTSGSRITWQPYGPVGSSYDILWNFIADTRNLPDGRVQLHYVVIDNSGNASVYQQDLLVMNNYPMITDLTLFTNNTGQGAVFTYNENEDMSPPYKIGTYPSGYLNSGFYSKNRVIGFGLETASGNPPLNYRVQHVTRERVILSNANLRIMANKATSPYLSLYTIADKGDASNAIWATLGVASVVTSNPVPGTHFVFQPTLADVGLGATGMNFTSAAVWAYRLVGAVATPVLNKSAPIDDPNYGHVDPTELNFNGTAYFGDGAGLINEKMGSKPEPGVADPANTDTIALFLIKVYDSVATDLPEDERLYDAVVVGMNVYLHDTIRPTAQLYDLSPYTETEVSGNNINFIGVGNEATRRDAADPRGIGENVLRGGLFNVGTNRNLKKSGHIEPINGTTAVKDGVNGYVSTDTPNNTYSNGTTTVERDKVSGKIILRGMAHDDQLIHEIRLTISGDAAETFTNSADGPRQSSRAILRLAPDSANTGHNTMQAVNNAQAWAVEDIHYERGHTVEWAYIWDTEQRSNSNTNGGPSANVQITVTVVDKLGGSGLGTAGETIQDSATIARTAATAADHNQVNVDIVPYVTGFERQAIYVTNRSRQGWYSFYQNEPNIAVTGYNLKASGNTTVRIQYGAAAANGVDMTINPAGAPAQNSSRIVFAVPGTAQSGKILVTATGTGGVEALNHNTNHSQSWNREYHSLTAGSDLWINKPYAHIWRSSTNNDDTTPRTRMGTLASSLGLDSPSMALEYMGAEAGRLHGAWTIFGETGYFYGMNNGAGRNNLYYNQTDPYTYSDISIYNGGGGIAGTGANTIQNLSINVVTDYIYDGQPQIGGRNRMTDGNTFTGISTAVANRPTERWKNPRIAKAAVNGANNNDTNFGRAFFTAYDSQNGYLWFARRETTTTTQYIIDGGTAATGNIDGFAQISTTNKSTNAGEYSAVDYDGTGPVVAYYDQVNDTVRLAYASSMTPAATNWTRREILSGDLYRGSGKYISMKVDKNNGIHLAFFNSVQNTVVYAYAASRTGTFTAHTIDKVVQTGLWTDIAVDDNGNPYIVYGNNGRMGNYDGARIAYRTNRTGSNNGVQFNNRYDTTDTTANPAYGWEALSMPANYRVSNDRLNIEAWPPTNRAGGTLGTRPAANGTWNAAIGYAGTDATNTKRFQIAYFTNPAWKDY